jgi:pilus assembly protein CpaC
VVNAKSAGTTSLVVYNEGGRYKVYDIESYVPNADQQVLLRVRVAEVNESAMKEMGFDFLYQGPSNDPAPGGMLGGGIYTDKVAGPSVPLTVGPSTDGFFSYSRVSGPLDLQTTWRLMEEKGDIRVLANPTLVARSGEQASFLAGGEFPVPIASNSGSTAGGGSAVTVTIEWKEFGVKVDFTPTVEEDGSITLKVAPEVSQIDFTNPLALSGFTIPSVVTRKTSTTVHLKGGEHLVISGLKQNEKTKTLRRVPILGQIPLLGFFFSSTRTQVTEREMLVVVSPELVTSALNALPELPTDQPRKK